MKSKKAIGTLPVILGIAIVSVIFIVMGMSILKPLIKASPAYAAKNGALTIDSVYAAPEDLEVYYPIPKTFSGDRLFSKIKFHDDKFCTHVPPKSRMTITIGSGKEYCEEYIKSESFESKFESSSTGVGPIKISAFEGMGSLDGIVFKGMYNSKDRTHKIWVKLEE